jgi:hypothetical protein
MAEIETEIRNAFERRLAAMPARPDLRAQIGASVLERKAEPQLWRVVAGSAAVLLLGAVTFYVLLARHIPPAPIIGPTPIGQSPTPTASAITSPITSPTPTPLTGTAGTPGPRLGAGMAWDAKDGYLLMFGGARYGSSGNITYNDTWAWSGDGWRHLNPPSSPPGRTFPAMAFDQGSQRVLLFGGGSTNSDPVRYDTWAWDGTTWTELHPTTTPTHGSASMVFDPDLPGIVLVADEALKTTWTWTGSNWSQLRPNNSPPSRGWSGLAYVNKVGVVLVGGVNGPPPEGDHDDVWAFKADTWTQLRQATRPIAGACVIAYDADARALLLLPFETKGTWTWDGLTWTSQHPMHSPPILGFSAMGYDPVGRQVVLFGGKTDSLNDSPVLDQTWTWNGSDWQLR